ncbi:hypothetical protein SeMB42_g05528 [Synchytrium endobioticum]|uniref:TRP C-terminal domain-containing protein n=1 Tax=Synchytrium endobioticum TaxID=286115 RepID=A0A507CMF4_9FUNG|nr:hypothetical protein SeLEV6574_g07025 [Synchytrium endobioticum]TPX41545.1 hypothetical protein SeMB42_g05528 [Synchytrium endobioticum]
MHLALLLIPCLLSDLLTVVAGADCSLDSLAITQPAIPINQALQVGINYTVSAYSHNCNESKRSNFSLDISDPSGKLVLHLSPAVTSDSNYVNATFIFDLPCASCTFTYSVNLTNGKVLSYSVSGISILRYSLPITSAAIQSPGTSTPVTVLQSSKNYQLTVNTNTTLTSYSGLYMTLMTNGACARGSRPTATYTNFIYASTSNFNNNAAVVNLSSFVSGWSSGSPCYLTINMTALGATSQIYNTTSLSVDRQITMPQNATVYTMESTKYPVDLTNFDTTTTANFSISIREECSNGSLTIWSLGKQTVSASNSRIYLSLSLTSLSEACSNKTAATWKIQIATIEGDMNQTQTLQLIFGIRNSTILPTNASTPSPTPLPRDIILVNQNLSNLNRFAYSINLSNFNGSINAFNVNLVEFCSSSDQKSTWSLGTISSSTTDNAATLVLNLGFVTESCSNGSSWQISVQTAEGDVSKTGSIMWSWVFSLQNAIANGTYVPVVPPPASPIGEAVLNLISNSSAVVSSLAITTTTLGVATVVATNLITAVGGSASVISSGTSTVSAASGIGLAGLMFSLQSLATTNMLTVSTPGYYSIYASFFQFSTGVVVVPYITYTAQSWIPSVLLSDSDDTSSHNDQLHKRDQDLNTLFSSNYTGPAFLANWSLGKWAYIVGVPPDHLFFVVALGIILVMVAVSLAALSLFMVLNFAMLFLPAAKSFRSSFLNYYIAVVIVLFAIGQEQLTATCIYQLTLTPVAPVWLTIMAAVVFVTLDLVPTLFLIYILVILYTPDELFENPVLKTRLSYLYSNLRKETIFFGAVTLIKTVLDGICYACLGTLPIVQIVVQIISSSIWAVAVYYLKPYDRSLDNNANCLGSVLRVISMTFLAVSASSFIVGGSVRDGLTICSMVVSTFSAGLMVVWLTTCGFNQLCDCVKNWRTPKDSKTTESRSDSHQLLLAKPSDALLPNAGSGIFASRTIDSPTATRHEPLLSLDPFTRNSSDIEMPVRTRYSPIYRPLSSQQSAVPLLNNTAPS